ncbi:MAG: bile acid:sodium symporter family protein [Planctomycetia bacterium]|nr:bile acid:sodium symporter family protein [Planctomycetia bacterium]
MNTFRHYLTKYLLLWLVLACFFAFFWKKFCGAEISNPFLLSKWAMQMFIALTMLMIGSLLPIEEVKQVGRRWKTVFGGTAVQFISMPLLAFLTAHLFHLNNAYFIGVVLVGCVPGAMASNMLTMIARGNVSYSVSLTTSATLLSPFIVPFALVVCLGTRVSLNVTEISLTLLLTVVLPVVLGFSFSRISQLWQNLSEKIGEIVANIVIIWIIASVVAQNRELIFQLNPILFLALLFLNLGGYMAGYWGGFLMKIDSKMRRALVLEIGMQNAGLGTFLATQYFPKTPEAALCCAMYTFGCMFTGIILAQVCRNFFSNDLLTLSSDEIASVQNETPSLSKMTSVSDTNVLPNDSQKDAS